MKVFISYSAKDQNFIPLLVALLDIHGIRSWTALIDVDGGALFKSEIQNAIGEADALVVAASENAAISKWVTMEVAEFRATRPNAPIIPLVLDDVSTDDILPGLGDYQAVDFTQSMLDGFERLLAAFGKEFLQDIVMQDRRGETPRRRLPTRRLEDDRRKADLIQRMRRGFWLAYNRETGVGKFDVIDLTLRNLKDIQGFVAKEAARYRYTKDGEPVSADKALTHAVGCAWEMLRDMDKPRAVIAIEVLAEELYRDFEVVPIGRRQASRRQAVDRRNEA